jgi:xylulose-5-phosphate/fructose-6-phosphate phosphoketolase
VLVGIGDVMTLEVLAAVDILRREMPELRLRMVNITDLLILEKESEHPHGLDAGLFEALFTPDAPVIVNFHGYPSAVKQLLFGRGVAPRFTVNGYREEGTTTTPFDMLVRNGTSRFDVVKQAIRAAAPRNPQVASRASERVLYYDYLLRDFAAEIRETGDDPAAIRNWRWPGAAPS